MFVRFRRFSVRQIVFAFVEVAAAGQKFRPTLHRENEVKSSPAAGGRQPPGQQPMANGDGVKLFGGDGRPRAASRISQPGIHGMGLVGLVLTGGDCTNWVELGETKWNDSERFGTVCEASLVFIIYGIKFLVDC